MDFYNSDEMVRLREDQKAGNMSTLVKETCYACIHDEKVTGRSRRTQMLEENPDLTQIDNIKLKHIGNLCNLKCLMCFPEVSSLYAMEAQILDDYDGDIVISHKPTETYLEGLKEVLPKVKAIKFVGGEPIINPETWNFLKWLKLNQFFHLEIEFTTNGTRHFTDAEELLLMWFKSVNIIVSIDAVGEKNDYIRFPSKFANLYKNYKRFKEFANHVNLHTTVTMLNIGDVDKVLDYFSETDVSVGQAISKPDFLSPENLPYSIKENYCSEIPHIQKILETKPNYQKFMEGMIYLKKRDVHRKTNLLNLWPEFESYYPIGTT